MPTGIYERKNLGIDSGKGPKREDGSRNFMSVEAYEKQRRRRRAPCRQLELDSKKGLMLPSGERKFESLAAYAARCNNNELRNKNNPRKSKNWNLKRTYGITVEDFDNMVVEQKGRCLICGEKPKKLFVDHCHKTQMVRALLCPPCNTVLGMVKENPHTLQMMIYFLEWWSGPDKLIGKRSSDTVR